MPISSRSASAQRVKESKEELVGDALDILDDLDSGAKKQDLDKLRATHLSLIRTWQGVGPEPETKDSKQTYHWAVARGLVSPLDERPISTLVQVPQKSNYRLYLRHVLSMQEKRPLTLRIAPVDSKAAATQSHAFGNFTLLDGQTGKQQEAKLPIRVESELQQNTMPDAQMPVWEFWDLELPAGACSVSLESQQLSPQVDALLLTESKTFRPSFSPIANDNTLQRIFVRFRLLDASSAPSTFGVSAALTYHWRGRTSRAGEELWGYAVGTAPATPAGQWSAFIDAAEAIVPGPGPWSTCRMTFQNVVDARTEVQFAWYPQEAAVVHKITTAVSGGAAMFRVPNGPMILSAPLNQLPLDPAVEQSPRWGVWDSARLAGFEPEEALVERYFAWARQAGEELKLPADHPLPKHLLFVTSCRVGAPHREKAATMLAHLGINWIEGAPQSVVKNLGLYDESSMTKVKVGDEIATLTPASVINRSPPLLAGFHRYLREQAELADTSVDKLFGVESVDRLRCLDQLPEKAGRYQRRLYYHSHRYGHLATIPEYARAVRQAEAEHKNAVVYNNYSPHPVFLTGHTMNTNDWFLLARAGAQTLGWGEDWASNGSWALGTNRSQCVSFYAALVECSVRKRGYPAGFYVGTNTGNSANKIFSCVAQGINIMHLYDWGPIDGWAEGSNAWSENQDEYKSVMVATHALGPADEMIAKGKREPRRTAILYNRSHEIMNGETLVLNHDWMWALIAMKSAQIPVDVIIEEDLTPESLAQYRVLYLGGLNLEARHLQVIADWVGQGGLLVGTGGSAMFDAYNDPNPQAVELFGAKQVMAPPAKDARQPTVEFADSDWFGAALLTLAHPGGRHFLLEPTDATPLARYKHGGCAAVTHKMGRGRTILFGFFQGYELSAAIRTFGPVRWFTRPLVKHLGRQRVEFSYPASEATLFEHATGLAVTLANFSPWNQKLSERPTKLSVATDRPIREVTSALRGPLPWKRVGERIEVETPSPAKLWVDTIIFR